MKKLSLFIVGIILSSFLFSQGQRNIDEKYSSFNQNNIRQTNDIALMSKYDVKFYHLNINVENTATTLSGSVLCKAKVIAPQIDTFAFELLSGLTIDSVVLNGTQTNVTRNGNFSYAIFPTPVSQGQLFESIVYYHGTPSSSGFFSGITNQQSSTWKCRVTWTLSEPFNAYQWWPCKQDLRDKIDSSWVFITTSYPNMAGSNGLLTHVENLGNGKRRYEWKSSYPIDYYLISFAVSKYTDYSFKVKVPNIADSVLVQNYVYDTTVYSSQLGGTYNCLAYFKPEIDRTVDFLLLYSEKYGPYPFAREKYGHSMAPLGGGMEHQTMTTLGTFNFYLVCHELSHQWFGDNVTCATWNDIFVNEGFADYSEYVAAQYLADQATADDLMLDKHQNVMSSPGGNIYIPITETLTESRIFDGRLSYNKGGAFLHMLRYETDNDSLFFEAFKEYQNRYADSVAVGLDFKNVLEDITGLDYTDMFDQWYFGEGYPTYSSVWGWANDTLYLKITHTTSTTTIPTFKSHLDIKLNSTNGDTTVKVYVSSNNENYSIYMPRQISGISIDPKNWIVNKVGTVTTSLPENFNSGIAFSVAPNPAKSVIIVYSGTTKQNSTLNILDITGRKVFTQTISTPSNSIDISSLSNGIYLIELINGEKRSVQKLIKE